MILQLQMRLSYLILQQGQQAHDGAQQSGLAGVVESKEEDFPFFLPQAKRGEDAIEPIEEKHSGKSDLI